MLDLRNDEFLKEYKNKMLIQNHKNYCKNIYK